MLDLLSTRDVSLADRHIFGAAILMPSNTCDLSTWKLTLDGDGVLAQTIDVCQPPLRQRQTVTLHQHVSHSDVQTLFDIASRVRFRHLRPHYRPADLDMAICGTATTVLKARLHGEITSVTFDSSRALAHEGFDEAVRYCELWDALVAHAPFVPYTDKR